MSERQKETAFLRCLILVDETEERRELEKRIAQVQRDERCVQRVAWGAALCGALAVAGLAYGAVLQENFPYSTSEIVIRILCELALASLICLMAFAGLLTVYREKLNRFQEECRQLITRLWAAHVGEPHTATLRGSHPEAGDREVAQATVEVNGCPDRLDSLREGVAHCVNDTSPERNSFA